MRLSVDTKIEDALSLSMMNGSALVVLPIVDILTAIDTDRLAKTKVMLRFMIDNGYMTIAAKIRSQHGTDTPP